MREPKANTSKEAVRLRVAAVAFANQPEVKSGDHEDRQGQIRNRELLNAAIGYARAAGVLQPWIDAAREALTLRTDNDDAMLATEPLLGLVIAHDDKGRCVIHGSCRGSLTCPHATPEVGVMTTREARNQRSTEVLTMTIQGIGWAIKEMQNGSRVARAGWNGRGMWIALAVVRGEMTEPFVYLNTAQGTRIPWNASQADLLAVDWELASD